MKKLAIVMMFAAAVVQAEDPLALYTFEGAVPGEAVTAAAFSGDYAAEVSTMGTGGALPKFSSDRPASYIYQGNNNTNCLAESPCSIFFAPEDDSTAVVGVGGKVKLSGLGTAIGAQEEFTIECFVKYLSGSTVSWVDAYSFKNTHGIKLCNYNGVNQLAIQNLGRVNKGGDVLNTGAAYEKWHHTAVVYKEGEVTYYVDHKKVGTMVYTQDSVANKPLYLGCSDGGTGEVCYGKVACFRVMPRALTIDEMMYAADVSPKVDGETAKEIAFYVFKDGEANTDVSTVTNSVGHGEYLGTAFAFGTGGTAPTFDSDCPGKYIFANDRASRILAEDPQSVFFHGDSSSVSIGSGIDFEWLTTGMALQEEFTVEFFVKGTEKLAWRTAGGFNLGNYIKICSGNGANYFGAQLVISSNPGLVGAGMNVSDGAWHHFALAYKEGVASIYVDYAYYGTIEQANTLTLNDKKAFNLGYGNGYGTTSEAFVGKASCLRVSNKALAIADFMYASDEKPEQSNEPHIVFKYRFDEGTAGASIETTKVSPLNLMLRAGKGGAINGSVLPRYNTSALSSRQAYVDFGDGVYVPNVACAEFFGYDANDPVLPRDQDWAGSYLRTAQLPSTDFVGSFTLEFYMKTRPEYGKEKASQIQTQTVCGLGKSDNDLDWKIAVNYNMTQLYFGGYTAAGEPLGDYFNCSAGDGNWHHIALVNNDEEKTVQVYVDRVQVYERKCANSLRRTSGYQLTFGRYCNGHGYNGYIDEVRVSDVVLTPDEFLSFHAKRGSTVILR